MSMYGLVNQSIEGHIVSTYGEEKWELVAEAAGVGPITFVAMDPYPDEVTYSLVGAASEILGRPPDDLLFEFGSYWIKFTGQEGYGSLITQAGSTLPEFLRQLDNLHTQVQSIMSALSPPSFWVSDETDNSLRLHYSSHRDGLSAFVVGLLVGLGGIFDVIVEVDQCAAKAQGADHDEFIVRYISRSEQ